MSIGEALAEARGRAGLTVAEVSQRTRIRETIISGIERDDYAPCGGDFYARGNIRSIANAVGADSEPLISEYDAAVRAPGALSAVSLDELVATAQASARRRPNRAGVLGLGLALVVALGFAAYNFIAGSPRAASPPPAAASHVMTGPHTGRGGAPPVLKTSRSATLHASLRHAVPAPAPSGPVATVRAYVAAINGHHYARAWRLGGRNAGGSYSQFASGFGTTARDTLTIVSVSGDVVTARITAHETDGTVGIYQGTYTVDNGVITGFDVLQTG